MQRTPKRYSWGLLGALFVLIIPLAVSAAILQRSVSLTLRGISHLESGQRALVNQPDEAQTSFKEARTTLDTSLELLRTAPWYTKLLTVAPPFRYQVSLTRAGYALAEVGDTLGALRADFPELGLDEESDIGALLGKGTAEGFAWYDRSQPAIQSLASYLKIAEGELSNVPVWMAIGQEEELREAQRVVTRANDMLPRAQAAIEAVRRTLGAGSPEPRTVLVLFQNNAELRPSGGFPGSFATLNASSGIVRGFSFGQNIYKLDAAFSDWTANRAPAPLITITPTLGFRDAAVGSGFRTDSSRAFARMYEKATDMQVDGIIYLDLSLLEDVVRLTGPLTLPVIEQEVTAETIGTTLTQYVERDYFEDPANQATNEPKEVFASLIPFLVERVQATPGASGQLPALLSGAFQRKSLQIWSADAEAEAVFASLQPADQPLPTENWLKIVNTNLGGQKSSRNIVQNVTLRRSGFPWQSSRFAVTINRQHTGTGAWPDGENRNFTEVYLPPQAVIRTLPENRGGESQLAPHHQVQLGTRGDTWKTVVEQTPEWTRVRFWTTVSVGEQAASYLEYELPRTLGSQPLYYLKQAGTVRESLTWKGKTLSVDNNLVLE